MAGTELWTIRKLITWTTGYFKTHQIEEPRLDAELLLGHVLQKPRIYLYTDYDEIVNPDELAHYRDLIKKRIAGYCTAVLIGEKEFMGLTFKVNESVLVPRPDTEAWLEKIIQQYRNIPGTRLLDLGTGSGAIAVSFLSFCKEASAVAVDISGEALAVAEENGKTAGISSRIEWREGDFLHVLKENEIFDVILSNPPYIPTKDIEALATEVRHEPHLALDGGEDGLTFYRLLAEGAPAHLSPGGLLAVEVGIHEAEDVAALFQNAGLEGVTTIKDYGGIERAVVGKLGMKNEE